MNHLQKHLSASLIALAALLAAPIQGAWAAPAPDLSSFAVLSGASGVAGTNNSLTLIGSTVTGDVGSNGLDAALITSVTLTNSVITGNLFYDNDGSVVSTASMISGSTTAPVPPAVISAFKSAYDELAPKTGECTTTNTLTGNLDGRNVAPGVYCVDSVAKAGTLTLTGGPNDVWIFKVLAIPQGTTPTGALTGTDFSVVMAGKGDACNVTWWVAEAATMTKTTPTPGFFQGNILAGAAITMTGVAGSPTLASFNGNAWAKAAVSMTDVTVTGCDVLPGPGGNPPSCDKKHKHHKHSCDKNHKHHKHSCDKNHKHHKHCKHNDYDKPHCDGNSEGVFDSEDDGDGDDDGYGYLNPPFGLK